jgi:uncharacterized cupin superfamily protein
MPASTSEHDPKLADGSIRTVSLNDPDLNWEVYEEDMPGDQTPEGTPPGEHQVIFQSADGRVTVGVWRRAADIGEIVGEGQCFDFVVDGEVTLEDVEGRSHSAGAGDLLIYREDDKGKWLQPGPIRKFYVHVRD